jgi:hypothetical protein
MLRARGKGRECQRSRHSQTFKWALPRTGVCQDGRRWIKQIKDGGRVRGNSVRWKMCSGEQGGVCARYDAPCLAAR